MHTIYCTEYHTYIYNNPVPNDMCRVFVYSLARLRAYTNTIYKINDTGHITKTTVSAASKKKKNYENIFTSLSNPA